MPPALPALPRSILIICHANTCRSIIAQSLLRQMLAECDIEPTQIRVVSGGVAPYARDGALVSMDARLVLRDEGIHISSEAVSTDLRRNRVLVESADLILAMTQQQIDMLRQQFPEAAGKPVFTLKAIAGAGGDIEDPVGKGEDVYAACLSEIKDCLRRALPRILAELEGVA